MGKRMDSVISNLRFVTGCLVMAISVVVQIILLLFVTPFQLVRIKACNYWGHVVGPLMMKVTGSPINWVGKEKLSSASPAIYVSNHTSTVDIFLGIWIAPVGTVGVAKKEIVYVPFFGQLYWLSGHLRLDRSNRERAIESMRALAETVANNRLSIYIWPEGTRSRDGRLMKFKKGAFHLALQTKLPIILKGVLTKEAVQQSIDLKLDGIVVSNHGGRRLDGMPASIDMLKEVVETADGKLEVLFDSGVRRGGDVMKALALGAKAVLIGRPQAWSLAAGGETGVKLALEILRDELTNSMISSGCATVDDVDASLLLPAAMS